MSMNFWTKVGNIEIYTEPVDFMGERGFNVYAINGTDIVGKGMYSGPYTNGNVGEAVDHMLSGQFDIVTMDVITSGIQEITEEYNGRLIYGNIAGFPSQGPDYFKKIDGTKYYKHFTHRPKM